MDHAAGGVGHEAARGVKGQPFSIANHTRMAAAAVLLQGTGEVPVLRMDLVSIEDDVGR